jgi:hypothetical protein
MVARVSASAECALIDAVYRNKTGKQLLMYAAPFGEKCFVRLQNDGYPDSNCTPARKNSSISIGISNFIGVITCQVAFMYKIGYLLAKFVGNVSIHPLYAHHKFHAPMMILTG